MTRQEWGCFFCTVSEKRRQDESSTLVHREEQQKKFLVLGWELLWVERIGKVKARQGETESRLWSKTSHANDGDMEKKPWEVPRVLLFFVLRERSNCLELFLLLLLVEKEEKCWLSLSEADVLLVQLLKQLFCYCFFTRATGYSTLGAK